jgi:hypothetical protein
LVSSLLLLADQFLFWPLLQLGRHTSNSFMVSQWLLLFNEAFPVPMYNPHSVFGIFVFVRFRSLYQVC